MSGSFRSLSSLRALAALALVVPPFALMLIHPLTPGIALVLAGVLVAILALRVAISLRDQQRVALREQSNLGAVASGVADCRRLLDETRNNLGMVADTVHHLRVAMEVPAIAADGVWEALDALGRRVDEQSANLGLVAGGLDDLRHASAGVELVQGRYAALSDSIIDVAAHVDLLSRTVMARENGRPDGTRPAVSS